MGQPEKSYLEHTLIREKVCSTIELPRPRKRLHQYFNPHVCPSIVDPILSHHVTNFVKSNDFGNESCYI